MPEKMLFRTLIPFLLALPLAFAHRIEIEAGEKECFYEVLAPQDKVSSLLSHILYDRAIKL